MTFQKFYQLLCEGSAPRSYSCLMLDCSSLFEHMAELHDQIDPADVYDDEPGHGIEKEVHCTCLYGIHTQSLKDIRDLINLPVINYIIGKVSLFKNDKYDVLKFDIDSKDLHRLNKELCDKLEFTNNYKDYKPHITIAYLKVGTGEKYLKNSSDLVGKKFTSNKYIFSDKLSNKVIFVV